MFNPLFTPALASICRQVILSLCIVKLPDSGQKPQGFALVLESLSQAS